MEKLLRLRWTPDTSCSWVYVDYEPDGFQRGIYFLIYFREYRKNGGKSFTCERFSIVTDLPFYVSNTLAKIDLYCTIVAEVIQCCADFFPQRKATREYFFNLVETCNF